MNTTTVQKNIMRRIYYAFAVRLATHPITLQSVVAVLALLALAQLVFVERVVTGFLKTPVGEMLPHALRVLSSADTITLIVFGILVFSLLSLGIQVRLPRVRGYQGLSTV